MESSHRFCTFRLGDHLFGVEVERVQEVLRNQRMTQVPLAPSEIGGLINLRGQIVTAIDMRRRLGLPSLPEDTSPMNVVLRPDAGGVALLVDSIGEVLDLDEDNFGPPPGSVPAERRALTRAVSQLDDELLLILDTDRVLSIPTRQTDAASA